MSRTRVLSAAVLSVGLMSAAASAALTPSVVYVPKTGTGAVAADSGLNGTRTFSVRVTQSTSEFFASADLQFNTSTNSGAGVYNTTGSTNKHQFGGGANLAFDTYVTSPGFETPNPAVGDNGRLVVLGGGTAPVQNGALTPNLGTGTTQTVDISWGDQQKIDTGGTAAASGIAGTYEIARITLKPNTTATIVGRVISVLPAGTPNTVTTAFPAGTASFISAVLGDGNNDGKVNAADLNVLSLNYNTSVAGGVTQGDFNEDGSVNAGDLNILSLNYLFGTPGSLPAAATLAGDIAAIGFVVPEPASVGFLALGSFALARRRNRR